MRKGMVAPRRFTATDTLTQASSEPQKSFSLFFKRYGQKNRCGKPT